MDSSRKYSDELLSIFVKDGVLTRFGMLLLVSMIINMTSQILHIGGNNESFSDLL